MRTSLLPLFLTGMVMLLVAAVPVSADLLTITDISPAVGYTGETVTVTITGTNFTTTDGDVTLGMDDEDDIDASKISSWSDTTIVCRFRIPSDTETGDWTLVVTRDDDEETEATEDFVIADPLVLTSISPAEGQMENESVEFTLAGSGLASVDDVYLYNNDYDNISADIDDVDSDEITGEFDLSDTDEDKYKVCVEDSYGTTRCGLSFLITTDKVGSISISSKPSDASIYIDNEYIGMTPGAEGNLIEGYHKVVLKKTGYTDWGRMVLVEEGDETEVDADLEAVTTVPTTVPTPEPTPPQTSPPPTERPTRGETIAAPPGTPVTTATTKASPVDPAAILAAAGLGLGIAVLRKQ